MGICLVTIKAAEILKNSTDLITSYDLTFVKLI